MHPTFFDGETRIHADAFFQKKIHKNSSSTLSFSLSLLSTMLRKRNSVVMSKLSPLFVFGGILVESGILNI